MDINTGVEIEIDDIADPLVLLTAAALNLTTIVNGTNTTTALVPFPQNTTIPWDDQEALNDLFQAWLRLEKLPPSTMIAQGVAATLFFFVYAIMSYAFWYVLAIIATSEAPQAVIVHKNDNSRSAKKDDDYDEEQDQTRYEWPYTSNLRKLLTRLISQAGPTSILRGIVCMVMAGFIEGVLMLLPIFKMLYFLLDLLPGTPYTNTVQEGVDGGVLETGWKRAAFTHFVLDLIAHSLAGIILSPVDTTHTHIVVTVHSYRTWIRRIPPLLSTIWHVAMATAVANVVNQTNHHLPHFLGWLFGISHHFSEVKGWWQSLLFAMMFCLVWTYRLAVKLPVLLALRRVQISLLKEEEETLIPVDRSFGTSGKEERTEGYTAPGILARPHEKVTFVQAWRSLVGTKEARRAYVQLLILFAKMVALQLGLALISYPITGWVDVLLPSAWWDPGPEIF